MEELSAMIFDIKHFAVHDGDGIRTTVYFKGCPLRCKWCHNPEGIEKETILQFSAERCSGCAACSTVCPQDVHVFKDSIHTVQRKNCIMCGQCSDVCPTNALALCGKHMKISEVLQAVLEDVPFYAKTGGVTLSGGECLCQSDFCSMLLCELHTRGINTAVDTSGFVPREAFVKVLPYTDLFLYDIKHFDPDLHRKYTGVDNQLILENLCWLSERNKRIEIRIPLIPGVNDDDETIQSTGTLLSTLRGIDKVRILPYNYLAGSKYTLIGKENTMPECQQLTEERLRKVKSILSSFDLIVV